MCEGLLRLTVDRIFPAPPPPASNVDTSMDASGAASCSKVQVKQARHFGKWRAITKVPPSSSHKQKQCETSSPSDARGGVRNPNAQVFSLTGRHLTRRSLTRAERGVREATAVKVLTVWWRSIADACRKTRSRKLWAMVQISAWVIKIVSRRRRKALRSKLERSARVIQARWRRATEVRRLAARMAACVVVQTVWRQRQCIRRCTSRRVRRRVFTGLQSWARLIVSRRQTMARKTIIRAIIAAMTRCASKRYAAAVIMRGLEITCNRRRQSRLRLQRFARTACLLRVRLAALSLARVDRVQSGAATTIAWAFRRSLTRSAIVRAAFAARALQSWSWRVLWRWEKRFTSTVIIQQAWRQRRIRQLLAVAEQQPRKSSVKTVAAEPATATNVRVCAVDQGEFMARDDVAVLDTSGSEKVGQVSPPRRQANSLPLAGYSDASYCSLPDRSVEEENTHSLRVPVHGGNGTSLALCNQLVSPATTARENWSDPDLCLADGGAQSSHVSEDGSLSYNETHCATMVTARGSTFLSGRSNPRTARRKGGDAMAIDETSGGILDLENILPDFIKRRQRSSLSKGKHRGWSEVSRQSMQFKGIRYRTIADGSRGLGDGWVTPDVRSRDEGLPYPPAGGMQPIDTRAQWTTRRWARTQGSEGRVGVAMKPAPGVLNQGNHRGEEAGSSHCEPRPLNSRCRSASRGDDHNSRLGWNRVPAKEVSSGRTGTKSRRSRVGLSSRHAAAKNNAKKEVGVRGAEDSLGSSIRWKGESGGVLEMLAFMEA